MNSFQKNYLLYLEDMLLSMNRIEEYIAPFDFEAFQKNQLVIDAVIRNFQIIGEAAKNIPEKIRVKYPSVPWTKMYGLRNLIAHEYFGIDLEMIWEITQHHLHDNKTEVQKIVALER